MHKRILITGEHSYLGTSLQKWLSKHPDKYLIETISVKGQAWLNFDFSKFDVVFHVAGIAHISAKEHMKAEYYSINRDLAIDVALKAKESNVKQFIFMSSINVYGKNITQITGSTPPQPSDFYGDSKFQAELILQSYSSDDFRVAMIRPPMIYGYGSKGNYKKLSQLAQRVPIFPNFNNKRSMLHIDNFCEFIKLIIDNEDDGVFLPQNKEYVKTSELVQTIAHVHGKRMILLRCFNWLIKILKNNFTIRKVFGDLYYEKSLSHYPHGDYHIRDFETSIKLTELGDFNEY